LLKIALLTTITPEIACELTGVREGASFLAYLHRNHYFTDLYGGSYRFHPLFREYLLDRARSAFDAGELAALSMTGGRLLARSGRIEEAIRLFLDARAYEEALALVLGHAQELLSMGRFATLQGWVDSIPEDMWCDAPWLFYWRGMGYLTTDPPQARRCLETAFALFESEADATGSLLSVAGVMNSIMLGWDDYRPLDQWIEWIDRNVDPEAPLSPPDTEASVAAAMVCGLTYRAPWHPKMATWIDRTLRASQKVGDAGLRLMVRGTVMAYHAQFGNFAEMYDLAGELRRLTLLPQAPPLVQLAFMVRAIQLHDWIKGSWEETMGFINKATDLATESGSHFHLGIIYADAIIAAFEMNDLELVREFLGRMGKLDFADKRVIESRCCLLWAFYHLAKNSPVEAYRAAEKGLRSALGSGARIGEAYGRICLAYALRKTGKGEDAGAQLDMVETMFRGLGVTHSLYLVRLTQAILLLDRGDIIEARRVLGEAFSIGRGKGYGMTLFFWWQREDMARLCAEALTGGIEVGYANELIRTHGLDVPDGYESLHEWPWRIRIHTFGGLRVVMDGKPLRFSRRIQKRPLALLKALIALGGREVHEEAIEDLLWPEAEGDAARYSFKTALSRLRRFMGGENMIELKDHKLTLAGSRIWLDTESLERLSRNIAGIGRTRHAERPEDVPALGRELLDLYRGDFLAGDEAPWIDRCRRVQRRRFVKAVETVRAVLVEAGKSREAAGVFQAAIQNGILREELSSS
jgi:tetratricopeptide (TPR) repeat protein